MITSVEEFIENTYQKTINPTENKILVARQWLTKFAQLNNLTYELIVDKVKMIIINFNNSSWNTNLTYFDCRVPEIFWFYIEIILDKKIPKQYQRKFI